MREAILEPFFRHLRIRQIEKYILDNSIICDLGCGPEAPLLNHLSSRISTGYGFDPLAIPIQKENIIIKKADILEGVDLSPTSVDFVTMLAVIEHIPVESIGNVFREAYRIMKDGGALLATTPTPKSRHVLEFLSYRLNLVSRREIEEHKHYYKQEELKDLLVHTGFTPGRINVSPFELGFNWFIRAEK